MTILGSQTAKKIKLLEEIEKGFKENRRRRYKRGKAEMNENFRRPKGDQFIGPPSGFDFHEWMELSHEFAGEKNNEENIDL